MTKDGSRVELYDIFNDWEEKENLAGECPEVVNRLMQIALDYNDSLPPFGSSDKHVCVPNAALTWSVARLALVEMSPTTSYDYEFPAQLTGSWRGLKNMPSPGRPLTYGL